MKLRSEGDYVVQVLTWRRNLLGVWLGPQLSLLNNEGYNYSFSVAVTWLSVSLWEAFPHRRLWVSRIITQGPVMGHVLITGSYQCSGFVPLWGVLLLELQMCCLYVNKTMIQCPLVGGGPFWGSFVIYKCSAQDLTREGLESFVSERLTTIGCVSTHLTPWAMPLNKLCSAKRPTGDP